MASLQIQAMSALIESRLSTEQQSQLFDFFRCKKGRYHQMIFDADPLIPNVVVAELEEALDQNNISFLLYPTPKRLLFTAKAIQIIWSTLTLDQQIKLQPLLDGAKLVSQPLTLDITNPRLQKLNPHLCASKGSIYIRYPGNGYWSSILDHLESQVFRNDYIRTGEFFGKGIKYDENAWQGRKRRNLQGLQELGWNVVVDES